MASNSISHPGQAPNSGPSFSSPPPPPLPPPSPSPVPNPQTQTKPTPRTCEFTTFCTANSPQTRKLISHIFGRNKTSTRSFPDHVWVYFCRKHYQRARYRDRMWAGTQCEVLEETLDRMKRWGGVRCWRVVVRKRAWRVYGFVGGGGDDDDDDDSSRRLTGMGRIGVDTDVDVDTGAEGDIDTDPDDNNSNNKNHKLNAHRNPKTKKTISQHRKRQRTQSGGSHHHHHCHRQQPPKGRRKPTVAKLAPIPNWLIPEFGFEKTFDDIRFIVRRLKEDIIEGRLLRFPDIEILPIFFP